MDNGGYKLLGFLAGLAVGSVGFILFILLWYEVLGFASYGADGLSGYATYILLGPLFALGGGIAGAVWLGRKTQDGGGRGAVIAAATVLAVLVGVVVVMPYVRNMFL